MVGLIRRHLLVGVKFFAGEANYVQMLQVTGFAYAPVAFMIFGLIPWIGFAISMVVTVGLLAAVLAAAQEGLEFGVGRTVVTVLAGWFLYSIGVVILGGVFSLFYILSSCQRYHFMRTKAFQTR